MMLNSMKVNIQVDGIESLKALIDKAGTQIEALQDTLDAINNQKVEVKVGLAPSQNK